MKNTDLTTLNLHQMPEKIFEREKNAGRLDENAIYLVEDEFDAESAIEELQQTVAQKSQVQIIRWGADDSWLYIWEAIWYHLQWPLKDFTKPELSLVMNTGV